MLNGRSHQFANKVCNKKMAIFSFQSSHFLILRLEKLFGYHFESSSLLAKLCYFRCYIQSSIHFLRIFIISLGFTIISFFRNSVILPLLSILPSFLIIIYSFLAKFYYFVRFYNHLFLSFEILLFRDYFETSLHFLRNWFHKQMRFLVLNKNEMQTCVQCMCYNV